VLTTERYIGSLVSEGTPMNECLDIFELEEAGMLAYRTSCFRSKPALRRAARMVSGFARPFGVS
jgi:hypothetical protein